MFGLVYRQLDDVITLLFRPLNDVVVFVAGAACALPRKFGTIDVVFGCQFTAGIFSFNCLTASRTTWREQFLLIVAANQAITCINPWA